MATMLMVSCRRDFWSATDFSNANEIRRIDLESSTGQAVPHDEFDPTVLDGVIKDTEGDIAKATDGWRRDKLSHKVDQLKALQAELQ